MVNDVSRLTESLHRSVVQQHARTSLQELSETEKHRLRDQMNESGKAFYSDVRGNRYRIERKRP